MNIVISFHFFLSKCQTIPMNYVQFIANIKEAGSACYGGPIKNMDAMVEKTGGQCFNLGFLELQGALSREREKCIIGLLCQVYDAVSLFYAPCLVFFYPTSDLIFSARLRL